MILTKWMVFFKFSSLIQIRIRNLKKCRRSVSVRSLTLPTHCDFLSKIGQIIQNNIVYKLGSRPRSISTGQLHMLPYFHIQPIYLVVYQGP